MVPRMGARIAMEGQMTIRFASVFPFYGVASMDVSNTASWSRYPCSVCLGGGGGGRCAFVYCVEV
jgi:hypothetical protein